jgi:hypothetical protein
VQPGDPQDASHPGAGLTECHLSTGTHQAAVCVQQQRDPGRVDVPAAGKVDHQLGRSPVDDRIEDGAEPGHYGDVQFPVDEHLDRLGRAGRHSWHLRCRSNQLPHVTPPARSVGISTACPPGMADSALVHDDHVTKPLSPARALPRPPLPTAEQHDGGHHHEGTGDRG